jgi:selenocysteine-specific elongation factor
VKERHYILATAGHVDHGKSSLVHALTGTDPDRLPEEKARGITIDLGFACLRLPGAPPIVAGIIDVPGHEDFVKNMVAGMSAVDAALLVVAADDGPMPQTHEHVEILAYLGVRRLVVALTKSDLASPERAMAETAELLRATPFAGSPQVAVSVQNGQGLDALRAAMVRMFEETPPPEDRRKPRLAVDRVFAPRGVGTVVTGTLTGGVLTRGQSVVVQPAGTPARIRAMQTHGRDLEHAVPGMRVALNLPELAGNVRRGATVTVEGVGATTRFWGVVLRHLGLTGVRTLRDKTRVHVHHGSADLAATVDLPEGSPAGGRPAVARLRFDEPVFALAGERFVVRDWSATHTLAGGVIVDVDVPRSGWRGRISDWHARAAAADDAVVWTQSEIAWLHAVPHKMPLRASVFSVPQIVAAAELLVTRGLARRVGDPALLVDAAWWTELRTAAVRAIDAHHAAHPEERGMALPALRALLGKSAAADVRDALLADLAGENIVRAGEVVKRAAHLPVLPAGLQRAGAAVRGALARQPLDPPARKTLAPDAPTRAALAFLLETGEAVEISPELVLSAEAVHHAAQRIRAHLRSHGRATVSELKQLLGSNRRVMVPLMEFFDRAGVTRRVGDHRVLPEMAGAPRPA